MDGGAADDADRDPQRAGGCRRVAAQRRAARCWSFLANENPAALIEQIHLGIEMLRLGCARLSFSSWRPIHATFRATDLCRRSTLAPAAFSAYRFSHPRR